MALYILVVLMDYHRLLSFPPGTEPSPKNGSPGMDPLTPCPVRPPVDTQVSPGAVGLHEIITMLQKGLQPNHHHPLLVGLGYTMIYPSNGLGVSNGVQCFTGQGTLRGPPLAAPGGASAQEAVTRRVRRRIRGVSYAQRGGAWWFRHWEQNQLIYGSFVVRTDSWIFLVPFGTLVPPVLFLE